MDLPDPCQGGLGQAGGSTGDQKVQGFVDPAVSSGLSGPVEYASDTGAPEPSTLEHDLGFESKKKRLEQSLGSFRFLETQCSTRWSTASTRRTRKVAVGGRFSERFSAISSCN